MNDKLKQAVATLIDALKTDPEYRMGWQANIAMAFKDEFDRFRKDNPRISSKDIHTIANTAADDFLDLLCK